MSKYIYVTPYKNGKPQRTVLMKKGGSVKDIGADYVVPVKSMNVGGGVTYEGMMADMNREPWQVRRDERRKTAGERYFGGFADVDGDLGFSPSSTGLYDSSVGFGGLGVPEEGPTYGLDERRKTAGERYFGGFADVDVDLGFSPSSPGLYDPSVGFGGLGVPEGGTEDKEDEDPHYYNPYGGMDVRQASFILGKSLSGEASTGTGMLAGAKVGLGLGRDIASGMGLGNREAFLREEEQRRNREARYEERGMAALARPGYGKEGGKITYSDILKYRDEGMQLMKKGGNIDFGQRMTGEYIEGLPEGQEDQAVVEVESGEHILQPDGSMQEVVGDKHSQGGEKLSEEDIQEGSIVISDYTKVGAEKAKYFRDKYNIKLTAGHTFADVVDRVEKKIGVTKITKELEDLYKKLEKEEKTTEHQATKDLNREYISEKIYEKEQEKAELEEERLELMEDVYNQQEGDKGQEGEESDIDYEFLKQVAQESGLDELQAQEVVQEFKRGGSYFKIPKYEDGGSRRKTLKEWFKEAKELGYTGGVESLEDKRRQAILPQMPDDWVLPPSSMTPPRKNVTEFGLDEAMYTSPDQALARNQTQFAAQKAAADSLMPNQKAAYLASLQESAAMVDMQAQAAADQMYSQEEAGTRRFNIGQRDKQSMAAGQNAESFEDKMFRTKAIYDENVRGFLDYMRNTNITRFKDVRNQNLVGSMMEDYYIDANGQVYIKPGSRYSGSVGQIGTGQFNIGEIEEERKKREAARKKKRAGTR